MKQLLLTTIAAVLLVGCGESQQSVPTPETQPAEPVAEAATPEPPTAKVPDISIHDATKKGNIEAVQQHLAAGTDVNAKGADGKTPLDSADGEIADLLRKHGGKTGEELALMPRLVQHGRFAFSFVAMEGKVYEIQDSFDLLNWEVIKTFTGTGTSVRFDEERDHDPLRIFYRVKLVE